MNNNAIIDRIRTKLVNDGAIKQDTIATQGYLRLESLVNQSVSGVSFNVTDGSGASGVTERRLKLTDRFTITHWGLFVGRCASTAAGVLPTDANRSLMKLYTNNNLNVFTTTGDNLRALYNGNMSVKVDRVTYIDGIDNQRFWSAGAAQEGLQQTVTATTGTFQVDGWDGPNYGFSMCQPEITLNGGGQNEISISLPNPTNFIPTGNFANFVVLIARGITWQGASKLN